MTVQRVRVGEVLRLDRRPVTPDPTEEYISIGIRSFGKGVFHYEPTPGGQLGKLRFFEVVPDRLVVSNIKAWEGAVAVSGLDDAGCVASNRFLTYKPVDDRIDVRWARWFFLTEHGNQLLQYASPGSADRNRTLAIDRFEALEIPLPSIVEQRLVAARLDRLAAAASQLIETRTNALRRLEALAESRLRELFVDPEASSVRVSDIAEVRGGIQKSTDRAPSANPVRYLTVAHVGRDQIRFDDPRYFEVSPLEVEQRQLLVGDVLVIEGNGSGSEIGRAALFCGADETFVHQNHVIRVRPRQELVDPDYLNMYLNSPPGRTAVREQARTSSGLLSLSVGRIMKILVSLPTLDEQRARVAAARRFQAQHAGIREVTHRAQRLADALLPAALTEAFAGLS